MQGNLKNKPQREIPEIVKSFLALGFGLFLVGLLVFGVELYFRHLRANYLALKPEDEVWEPGPWLYGSDYGYEYLPEVVVEHKKTSYGKPVFSSVFSIDACGHRITPVDHREDRTHFMAFFGCSFTFGQGVNDDETLPAQMARRAPAYMPYNYALPGYGPQQMLLKLMHYDLRGEIAEKQGVGLYLFLDDHVERAIGSMRHITSWAKGFPCFEEQQGALAYLGSFEQAHPYRTWFHRLLARETILRYYGVNWPISPSIYDMDLTAAIIAESAKRFAELFPGSPFHVVFYPQMSCRYGGDVLRALGKYPVSCLDYRTLFRNVPLEQIRFLDLHPTPEAYACMARVLVSELQLGAQCPGS